MDESTDKTDGATGAGTDDTPPEGGQDSPASATNGLKPRIKVLEDTPDGDLPGDNDLAKADAAATSVVVADTAADSDPGQTDAPPEHGSDQQRQSVDSSHESEPETEAETTDSPVAISSAAPTDADDTGSDGGGEADGLIHIDSRAAHDLGGDTATVAESTATAVATPPPAEGRGGMPSISLPRRQRQKKGGDRMFATKPNHKVLKTALASIVVLALMAGVVVGAIWLFNTFASSEGDADSAASVTTVPTTAPPTTLPPPPAEAPVLLRIETTDPVVFITIDDGYKTDPRVLDLLAQRGVTASAFVLADHALDNNAVYWKKLVEQGGSVEDHSMTHRDFKTLSPEEQRGEICGAADRIQQVLGTRPVLFRPPYGSTTAEMPSLASQCGIYAILKWSVEIDRGEWKIAPGEELDAGDIVLMHWEDGIYDELVDLFNQMDARGLTAANILDYLGPTATKQ